MALKSPFKTEPAINIWIHRQLPAVVLQDQLQHSSLGHTLPREQLTKGWIWCNIKASPFIPNPRWLYWPSSHWDSTLGWQRLDSRAVLQSQAFPILPFHFVHRHYSKAWRFSLPAPISSPLAQLHLTLPLTTQIQVSKTLERYIPPNPWYRLCNYEFTADRPIKN